MKTLSLSLVFVCDFAIINYTHQEKSQYANRSRYCSSYYDKNNHAFWEIGVCARECMSSICEIEDWGEEQVFVQRTAKITTTFLCVRIFRLMIICRKFIAKRIVCERSITWEKRNRLMEIRRQRNALAFGPTFLSKNKYYPSNNIQQ